MNTYLILQNVIFLIKKCKSTDRPTARMYWRSFERASENSLVLFKPYLWFFADREIYRQNQIDKHSYHDPSLFINFKTMLLFLYEKSLWHSHETYMGLMTHSTHTSMTSTLGLLCRLTKRIRYCAAWRHNRYTLSSDCRVASRLRCDQRKQLPEFHSEPLYWGRMNPKYN